MSDTKTYSQDDMDSISGKYESAIERSRSLEGELVNLKKEMRKFEGIDLDAITALKEENISLKNDRATISQEAFNQRIAEVKDQVTNEFSTRVTTLTNENAQLQSALFKHQVVGGAMNEVRGLFNDDVHDVVEAMLERDLAKDDYGIFIKDEKGNPRLDASGGRLSVRDYASAIIQNKPSLARAETRTGSGQTRTPGASTGGINPSQWASMTAEQRSNSGLSHAERMRLNRDSGLVK